MPKKDKTKEQSRTAKSVVKEQDEMSPVDSPESVPAQQDPSVESPVQNQEPVDPFVEFSEKLKELLAGLNIEAEAAETIAQAFVDALSAQQEKFDGEVESTEQETLQTIEENVKKLNAQWQTKIDSLVTANKSQLKELHEKVKKVVSEDYESYKTELKEKAALMIESKISKLTQPAAPVVVKEEVKVETPVVNEELVKLQTSNKELKSKVNRLIEEKIALISKLRKAEGESKKLQENKDIPLKVELGKPKISEAINKSNADSITESKGSIYNDFERLSGIKK